MLKFEKEDLVNEVQLGKEPITESESPESPNGRPGRAQEALEQQNKKLMDELHNLLNDNARLHERLKTTSK